MLSFQYISHRVLRWTLAPLFLPIVLGLNVYLVSQSLHWVYSLLLLAQVGFYLLSLLGYVFRHQKINIPGFFAPYYFVVMNYSVYAGFIRFMKGQQKASWEKSKRANSVELHA